MEYISSDTNIWIDFQTVDALELPFRLDCTYLISSDTLNAEWLKPKGRGLRFVELGLKAVDITTEEFYYADEIQSKNKRLSVYDCLALAIAKFRGIVLLTGDRRLRQTAEKEGVMVHGSLWIFDELLRCERITTSEYKSIMAIGFACRHLKSTREYCNQQRRYTNIGSVHEFERSVVLQLAFSFTLLPSHGKKDDDG